MANNRELLKEALADAKSLREMAITNAKAALEESFAPQIKTMLSAKLQEMEEEEEEEEVEINEMKDEEEDENEDLNLDEILAELEGDDDPVSPMDEEDEESDAEEGDVEEEDEALDLEDMSEDDLKGFIESVIADMVEAGSLEAGEDMEGEDMEDEDMEDMEDEDINIDELLAEVEDEENIEEDGFGKMSTDGKEGFSTMGEKALDEEELDENFLNRMAGKLTGETKSRIESIASKISSGKRLFGDEFVEPTKEEMEDMVAAIKKDGGAGTVAVDKSTKKVFYTSAKDASGAQMPQTSTFENLQTELNETRKVNKVLRRELNEINLLNAKLLYTNRIFKAKNLTEGQKVKVLSTFDKASTVNEIELVYETLNGTFNAKKKPMNENLGRASKSTGITKSTKPIIEVNDAYSRMRELAFYNSKH
tara:strand:+ start:6895 stop:8160 length:1266 start_codon:yes stop_codon:yes gene_type:complete